MILDNKVILIISPQAWGKMFLSKHHYAIELAKLGNEVYFLNPPDNDTWSWRKKESRIKITPHKQWSNLYLIDHQLSFPFLLKYHARGLFNKLMDYHLTGVR